MILTADVFGVNTKPVLSYIERDIVDAKFKEAIASDKQVIVYGSSKQGKTALVSKYLPYDQNIVVRLSPDSAPLDIYSAILKRLDIQIKDTVQKETGAITTAGIGAKVKAIIPFFGGGELDGKTEIKAAVGTKTTYKEIPTNLELPDDIAHLYHAVGCKKKIILENFHYLPDEIQKKLAFDLRNFQELGVHFIILGVWREKNRLAQFNGDLLDRAIEVPVEPWEEDEFRAVAARGAEKLNVEIAPHIVDRAIEASFSSIGVFQEVMKETCLNSGIIRREGNQQRVENELHFEKAVRTKANDYAFRHQRALESIASGNRDLSPKDGVIPLYLSYYFVKVVLAVGFDGLRDGLQRSTLQEKIKEIHHRSADVRPSDMSNFLNGLAGLQAGKEISPPIIDYDKTPRKIQVVDSTFYFFLKNAPLLEISRDIPNPLEEKMSKHDDNVAPNPA